ncbi:hypothetical protein SSS_03831 [Sarcoptes scabiei]|uniref:Chitin-binding type-2 domain-containing protein n=1 Tax=Sarcoptes scabiei TaxID=52283 RepID=A0A834RD61_SARSC|nr:hypothetical protein SSS_03831 [Sarcoptes scabiei]
MKTANGDIGNNFTTDSFPSTASKVQTKSLDDLRAKTNNDYQHQHQNNNHGFTRTSSSSLFPSSSKRLPYLPSSSSSSSILYPRLNSQNYHFSQSKSIKNQNNNNNANDDDDDDRNDENLFKESIVAQLQQLLQDSSMLNINNNNNNNIDDTDNRYYDSQKRFQDQDLSDSMAYPKRIRGGLNAASGRLPSPSPPIIKFSVKDGVNEQELLSSSSSSTSFSTSSFDDVSREKKFSSDSQSFFDGTKSIDDDNGDSNNSNQPRRIKMGSFLKPRSLWRSGDPSRVVLEKYDMSDIFCKTKFKPMINPPSAVFDISRNGRHLKRSSSKNEEQNVASESKPIRFVNSEWTPLTPPRFRLAHRLGIHINRSGGKQTLVLTRSKRQIVDLNHEELEKVIGNLPQGAVVKKIDPSTTELLLRLLRNTSASEDIERKKITKIYYVYLGPKGSAESSKPTKNNNDDDFATKPIVRDLLPPPPRPPPIQSAPVTRFTTDASKKPQPKATTTTTTTTTTTEVPPIVPKAAGKRPGFTLNELDYEYGEILCEGRFSGGMPDLRNDCRIYFECNPNTIDTYACPEHQRYDLSRQQCVPEDQAFCPRFNQEQNH